MLIGEGRCFLSSAAQFVDGLLEIHRQKAARGGFVLLASDF
jgi:hypothetical protein